MLKVMYQIVLKASEKLDLEYEHRKSRDALKSDRIKAIFLLIYQENIRTSLSLFETIINFLELRCYELR